MLGPASLRSQQPTKSSIKTYGSRNKRSSTATSTGPPRQFGWDRLANERKARLEEERARRAQHGLHSHVVLGGAAAETEDDGLELQLYSDTETEDEAALYKIHPYPEEQADLIVRAQSASDERSGTAFSVRKPYTEDRPLSGAAQTGGRTMALGIRQEELLTEKEHISETASAEPSLPSLTPAKAAMPDLRHKVLFQEEVIFKEGGGDDDDEADGDEGDEVLFRMPSFHILQKLKELPKRRSIEPRVNPFGFSDLPGEAGASGGHGKRDVWTTPPADPPSSTTTRNLFLDSPTTKKSMEILNKRAQQLVDLQQHRESKHGNEPAMLSDDTSMETEADYHSNAVKSSSRDGTNSLPNTNDMDQAADVKNRFTSSLLDARQITPEPEVARNMVIQDDSVDLALGKRMSTIEITPQRRLAKQRKMTPYDPASPSIPPAPLFLHHDEPESPRNDNHTSPFKLFLDRDIPEDEKEEFDSLFKRARQNRRISPLPLSSPPALFNAKSGRPSALPFVPPPNGHRNSSSLAAPTRSRRPKFERLTPPRRKYQPDIRETLHRQDPLDQMPNPFLQDTMHYQQQQITLPNTPAIIPISERASSRPAQRRTPSPPPPPSQSLNHQPQQEQLVPPRVARPMRSLRRPPAVLVSSRKSIFRPTVDDLVSICDQQFFAQFQDPNVAVDHTSDHCQRAAADQNQEYVSLHSHDVLDFDSLLPEFMVGSLTKIGEASYSEVYTVDLPIKQRQQQRRAMQLARRINDDINDDFALFKSLKLNTYIKESTEDDLLASQDMANDEGRVIDGGTTKLVMKVMPFYDDRSIIAANGSIGQGRGRRTKGRAQAEPTLLALEDIYREAMVSTQIMHGWKGFIGSFGALVMKGKYPKTFLSAWDRFRKQKGTESERPDQYTKEQLYCVILLPYGGIDLEHCPLANWQQAWSVLTQVAASLESKEQAPFWFEHRDLHWGNILVKGTRQDQVVFPKHHLSGRQDRVDGDKQELCRSIPTCGIIVQMIDFTLARVQGDKGNLIYMDLEKDQDLFRGHGDYQFEIYRKMRKQIGKDWAASCPRTNLFTGSIREDPICYHP
ncbi:hypothetical protein BGZ58_007362 [Dissophora ornata]|nr:hypothetical protein BGZ58_007362 [Dissophora ornata]